jgi:hypothetical protein
MLSSSYFKSLLRRRLAPNEIERLKKIHRRGQKIWARTIHPTDLRRIGRMFRVRKYDWYYPLYERHFGPLRRQPLNLLEIGIGGYETSLAGGDSLRMWESYLPRARVHGLDLHDKSPHDAGRVRTFMGSQADEEFLRKVVASIGCPDIIIDDGSHINEHILISFKILFPILAANGIYVIEDTQSSYWEPFGGSSKDLCREDTTMGFIKSLMDGINHKELRDPHRAPTPFDSTIVGVHCYHNIVFIQKGRNDTGHNLGE